MKGVLEARAGEAGECEQEWFPPKLRLGFPSMLPACTACSDFSLFASPHPESRCVLVSFALSLVGIVPSAEKYFSSPCPSRKSR